MRDYTTYEVTDLLQDENFIEFCRGNEGAAAFWNAFLLKHPEQRGKIDEAQKMLAKMAVSVTAVEKQLALENLRNAVALEKQGLHRTPVLPIAAAAKKWRYALVAAAVLTGVVLTAAIWLTKKQSYDINNTPVTAFAKAKYKEIIQAAADERREVTLPDGSAVTLNYGSSIKLADDYNQQQRWVYLEGEAFFSVKPNRQKPFVVITGKNATSALGTSFKVRNYAGEKVSDIMLATGKVKVQSMLSQSTRGDLILIPGEKAYCDNGNLPVKTSFDLAMLDNWRSLKIELDKANLDKIIATLEFNYGVQVKLQNKPVKEFAFTGKFDRAPLQNVLEAISFTNKFSYTQKGNIVSIMFQ